MNQFADTFALSAWPSLVALHGLTSATHTPPGGTAAAVSGIWTPREVEPSYNEDGEQQRKGGMWRCLPADLSSISDRDVFTISGEVYGVERWTRLAPIATAELVRFVDRTIGADEKVRI